MKSGGNALIGVVIVANGNIACELLACLEQIVGKQAGMSAISLNDNYDRKQKQEEICQAVSGVDEGHGVIVVTDIYGSSPANLSLKACCGSNRVILTGANVPMLVKLAKLRHHDLHEAALCAAESGRKYVRVVE